MAARPLQGTATVSTAGTAVVFSSNQDAVVWMVVRGLATNAGSVYIGDSTVSASTGYTLGVGTEREIPIPVGQTTKLSYWYVDAANNGDKVEFLAVVL